MDILGYQQLMKEAEETGTQAEVLEKLHGALYEGRQWLEEAFDDKTSDNICEDIYALKAFTDNIVIGWPILHGDGEWAFGDAFWKLAMFQFNMIVSGFFVRGAISLGDAYVDDIAVFGRALMEAHDAESKDARDPRIVLTESAICAVKSHVAYYFPPSFAPQTRDLLIDSDGQWFLNYLNRAIMPIDDENPQYESLNLHKQAVERSLRKYKYMPTIFSKFAWVAGYHNFFCDQQRHIDAKYRIETDVFRATPISILSRSQILQDKKT